MDSNEQIALEFVRTISNFDFEKQLSLLSDDVRVLGASRTTYGKRELETYYSNFENPMKDFQQEIRRNFFTRKNRRGRVDSVRVSS